MIRTASLAGLLTALPLVCVLAVLSLAPTGARAAELVMFTRAGCSWCETFDREIEPVPTDLAFVEVERLTPVFVLVDKGREIGRIRGYPGEAFFWDLLGELIGKMAPAAPVVDPLPRS